MAISVVGTPGYNTVTGSASVAVTIAGVTSGNALVAVTTNTAAGVGGTSTPSGVGGTWVKAITNEADTGFFSGVDTWYNLSPTAGSTSCTLNFSGSYGTKYGWVFEVHGMDTTTPTNGSATIQKAKGTGTTVTAGPITPTGSPGSILLIAAIYDANVGVNITSNPSGYTNVATGGVGTQGGCDYEIVTSPSGSYSASWGITNPYTTSLASIIAFNAAGGSPPAPKRRFWNTIFRILVIGLGLSILKILIPE